MRLPMLTLLGMLALPMAALAAPLDIQSDEKWTVISNDSFYKVTGKEVDVFYDLVITWIQQDPCPYSFSLPIPFRPDPWYNGGLLDFQVTDRIGNFDGFLDKTVGLSKPYTPSKSRGLDCSVNPNDGLRLKAHLRYFR